MKCPKCNFENDNKCKFCINCGYPLQTVSVIPELQPVKPRKPWYKRWWIWILMALGTLMLMVNSLCICGMVMPSRKSTPDTALKQPVTQTEHTTEEQPEKAMQAETEKQTEKTTVEELDAESLINKIVESGFIEVPASVLYNYYEDYNGKKVVTAVKITNISTTNIYSDMEEDKLTASLWFDFDKKSDMNNAREGDYAIIFGTGDGKSILGNYRQFKNCFVAAVGEQAEIEYDKLSRQAIETEKKKQSQAEEKVKEEKESYIDSCETIDYDTLSRNPDKYKGVKFTFKGKVVQVIEPDTLSDGKTTLRINVTKDEDFDIWDDTIICTVTIANGTDRILEDDIITIWGECNGLTSYTSIFGQKISLPEIDIKYFEIEE